MLNIKLISEMRWNLEHLVVVKLPAGKQVLILNGPYRDTEALLEGIDEKNFSATLTLDSVSISRKLLGFSHICQKLCHM